MAQRVLVTGVGGQPGFDLARRLLELGCEVVATDADPLANGLLLPGVTPRLTPPVTAADYPGQLLALCRETRPDALWSAVESELPHLLDLSSDLEKTGVRMWLPPRPAVRACLDKALFHQLLTEHNVPTPASWLPSEIDEVPDGVALVVKPRRGQGSKNVVFCSTRRQARMLCELVPEPIIQTKLDGHEFTADCVIDRGGRASVVLRYRLLTKGGLSMVSETFHDQQVHDRVVHTLEAIGTSGLCCVQGFVRDSPGERVLITEMNARIAGGFMLAEAAGADLVDQTLAGLWQRPIDHDRLTYRPGVRLAKATTTLAVVEDTRLGASSSTGHVSVPNAERKE
ncbi:ATP-grasp domain-containing protein [Nocardia sp. NBC_00508]|uniref:ATP-grasp domain-containing protein n=1 Tax=Nocardia sp. NBC_00508 TaxID=2975992 RepID=UPI002E813756|nr:ATP-grasp domain-containing protein [Nocardia sp. NBC_00508]WUD65881.1 ATP-grasp domain-containing protein [Nocardia sp. NBC_00508]